MEQPKELKLYADGLMTSVLSDDPSDLPWLRDFMAPGDLTSGPQQGTNVVRRVSLESNSSLAREWRAKLSHSSTAVAAYVLDTEVVNLPCDASKTSGVVAMDTRFGTIYRWYSAIDLQIYDGNEGRPDGRRARGALMRAVRELAMDHRWRKGGSFLHGAAVCISGKAILICGDKNSGKTSLLCAALLGLSNAELISNDRISVTRSNEGLLAASLPTVVSIRPGSQEVVPNLAARLENLDRDYTGLRHSSNVKEQGYKITPAQMAAALEVPVREQAAVSAIIFSRIDGAADPFTLRRMDPSEARQRICGAAFAAKNLGRCSDFFSVPESGTFPTRNELTKRLDSATSGTPCFDLRMGPGLYRPEAMFRLFGAVLD
jgi:hypothetical protein